jgi:hypothetical protein
VIVEPLIDPVLFEMDFFIYRVKFIEIGVTVEILPSFEAGDLHFHQDFGGERLVTQV